VSPTYSREIQRQEFGYGLEGLLFKYRDKLSGIINGIDYQEWDPGHDKYIFRAYEQSKLGGKLENKLALQKEVGLKASKEAALVGMVGRLADQKGFDLVAQSIEEMLRLNAQIILLGTGDAKYHQMLEKSAKKYKGKISVNLRFDNALAHKIYAACDMFLMPSRFEPCGLGQMISFRYGTLPIVRKTGGLADTVFDYDLRTKQGNGFVFENYSQKDFLNAVKKAINVYKNKKAWQELVLKVMGLDFSWNNSAKRYLQLYQRLAG
jgi:starch synthase